MGNEKNITFRKNMINPLELNNYIQSDKNESLSINEINNNDILLNKDSFENKIVNINTTSFKDESSDSEEVIKILKNAFIQRIPEFKC